MKNKKSKCTGCHNYSCFYIEYNKYYLRCPCSNNCLIFAMCSTACDEWNDYVSFIDADIRQTNFRIRAWPMGRLHDHFDERCRRIKVFILACCYSIYRSRT